MRADRDADAMAGRADRALAAGRVWAGWSWMLFLLAAAHILAVVLDVTDRAAFQGIPSTLLADLSDHAGWSIAHAAAATGLLASVGAGAGVRSWACNVSSAFLAAWSMILLMVGVSVDRGVSLLGPTFGIVLAVAAQVCAQMFFAESVVEEAARQARALPDDGA